MERILVPMDPMRTHLFAGIHALNLAKRINAKVLFLLIFPMPLKQTGTAAGEKNEAAKKKIETLIEEARSDGITVDYYQAYGDFESELVGFVQENKVTLLVIECPIGRDDSIEASKNLLDKLRHRINCRIEVVNEKQRVLGKKG